MNYSNIATILNSEIVSNSLGNAVTVAEDLTNIVEFGTLISNLTADQLKTFQKNLVCGVYNYVLARELELGSFELLRDAVEYGGGLQRIMAEGMFSAQDSHLLNLVNGQNYLDGKFYGFPLSAKVYESTKAFKVVHSISDDTFSQYFMNAEDLFKFMGLLEVTERNTIKFELYQLEKRIIVMLAASAVGNNRYVPLVTTFNQKILGIASSSDPNWKTLSDLLADRTLCSYFYSFVKSVVMRLKDAMKEVNTRYNDTTVETFSNDEDIKMVGISSFFNSEKFLAAPIEFNPASWNIDIKTIVAWQNPGTDMLPDDTTCETIEIVDNSTTPPSTVTIQNVVGVLYDKFGAGVTIRRDKTTIEEIGSEGFRNIHHHLAMSWYCDERLSSVALTLD